MILGLAATFAFLGLVTAQTWCNKNYHSSQPVVPPGGQFPIPPPSSTTFLAFRCAPAFKPYLASDAALPASIIIDAPVGYSQIAGAAPIVLSTQPTNLSVTVSLDGTTLSQGLVLPNTTKTLLPFSLSQLTPRVAPYNITCSATYASNQVFSTSTLLSFLPNPTSGSATKMDQRTGALLARPPNGVGDYAPVFPIGFYTSFYYLAANLSILNELATQGFNIVHPNPPYDNTTALDLILDRMQEVGLYLMYDMRFSYQDTAAITSQVTAYQSRPNLLLWYSADEPDGSNDPVNATVAAHDTINSVDPYHPVSLVLNCENYKFDSYAAGADIILQDTYFIGVNVTWSVKWNTPCTPDYGVCGCDNCKGSFEDITTRMDEFNERVQILGWEREKAIWAVPQGFGQQDFWSRYPTGMEFVLQSILSINHGALGLVSWSDPTTADIKNSASLLAHALPFLTPFFFNPNITFAQYTSPDLIDVGIWDDGKKTLVLAGNMNYASMTLDLRNIPGTVGARLAGGAVPLHVEQVLNNSGAHMQGTTMMFESVGSGAFVPTLPVSSSSSSSSQTSTTSGVPSVSSVSFTTAPCLIVTLLLFAYATYCY